VRALHLRPLARFSETMHADTQDSDPLDAVREEASAHGVHVEALGFASANPAEDIARIAAETRAPFVLLGAHRSAFSGDNLGGNVARVIQRAGCDVLVLVDRGLVEPRRVRIVQPDARAGGDEDARALHRLSERLRASGVEVHEQSDPVDAVEGADLIVAPHTVAPPLDPRCSWVAVCAGRAEADPTA
jgi:hypothetical protein